MSTIEVKRPEDVTSREDFISCKPFSCKLKALACVKRRSLVVARSNTMSACFNCPVGPVVETNSGGALSSDALAAATKSPAFNWGFQGFGRGLAIAKRKAKNAKPNAPPPKANPKEESMECKQCPRQLRKRRLDSPVPTGTEGLCNECRRKITRRKKKHEDVVPAEPEVTTQVTIAALKVKAPKKPKKKKKKPAPAPSAPSNGILRAPPPPTRAAAYVARGTDDRTLAELKEAIDLVDAIGWDEARALARRFQSRPLRSASL